MSHLAYNGLMPTEPLPPTFPPAEMIYDEIMGALDPRLKTTELGFLTQRYGDLKPEEREKLLMEFAYAFVAFEKKYEEYHDAFRKKVDDYKEHVTAWAKELHGDKDRRALAALEKYFAQTDAVVPRPLPASGI